MTPRCACAECARALSLSPRTTPRLVSGGHEHDRVRQEWICLSISRFPHRPRRFSLTLGFNLLKAGERHLPSSVTNSSANLRCESIPRRKGNFRADGRSIIHIRPIPLLPVFPTVAPLFPSPPPPPPEQGGTEPNPHAAADAAAAAAAAR